MLALTSKGPAHELPPDLPQDETDIHAPNPSTLIARQIDKGSRMSTMGDRIKARRLEFKLSQKQLAQKVGVTRQTVSAWEHGISRDITGVHLESLGRALDVATRWIVTGQRDAAPLDFRSNGEISDRQKVLIDQILRLTDNEIEKTIEFVSRLENEQRELYEQLRARFDPGIKKH